jgi:hypothetical protein
LRCRSAGCEATAAVRTRQPAAHGGTSRHATAAEDARAADRSQAGAMDDMPLQIAFWLCIWIAVFCKTGQ